MADKTNSLHGQICDIILEETLYLRHYIGQVLSQSDELNIGMVQVAIPELGWDTADTASWCYPRQSHRMSVPEIGEWVEVYFMNGDRNRPVYLEACCELKTDDNRYSVPKKYPGNPRFRVIYQSPFSGAGIWLDDDQKTFTLDADNIVLGEGGTEPFVLGTLLNSYLSNLVTALNTALGTKLDGTGTTGTLTAPSGILSTTIKGK